MFEILISASEENARSDTKESELQESLEETLYLSQFALNNAPISIFQVGDNRRIIDVNDYACQGHGYTREELCGMDILEVDTSLTPQKWVEHRRLVEMNGSRTFETVHRRKNGTRFPVEVSVKAYEYHGKRLSISFAQDITERKRADLALEEAEEWFRAMFENIVIGVYQITPDGKVLNANPALAKMLGYDSTDELTKDNLRECSIGPDYSNTDFRRKIDKDGQVAGLERPWRRSDGSSVWVRESVRAIRDNAGTVMYYEGTAEDISYRMEMEEALRKSEEQYRSFFEEDVTAAFLTFPDGTINACNPAFVRMFGFKSRQEALATNVTEIYPDENSYKMLAEMIEEERTIADHELELKRRDGSPAFVRANFVGIFDENDSLIGIKQYIIDETERKSLEQQLIQAQKLEGIGRLAGGVAHDYNNILSVILGHGKSCERSCSKKIRFIVRWRR